MLGTWRPLRRQLRLHTPLRHTAGATGAAFRGSSAWVTRVDVPRSLRVVEKWRLGMKVIQT